MMKRLTQYLLSFLIITAPLLSGLSLVHANDEVFRTVVKTNIDVWNATVGGGDLTYDTGTNELYFQSNPTDRIPANSILFDTNTGNLALQNEATQNWLQTGYTNFSRSVVLPSVVGPAAPVNGPGPAAPINGPADPDDPDNPDDPENSNASRNQQQVTQTGAFNNPIAGVGSLSELLLALVNALLILAVPVVGFFFVYAGFLYVIARGNPEALTKARQALTWAAVGTVIIFGANAIVIIIQNLANAFR